jgi:hypothetical protein
VQKGLTEMLAFFVVFIWWFDFYLYICTQSIKSIQMDTNINEAKKWFRSLSINEQKLFANEHLAKYEVDMLIGDTAKYTSVQKWNQLHLKLYKRFLKENLVVQK